MSMTSCLKLILDEEHAVKLSHLAERTHARPGTITRSWSEWSGREESEPHFPTDLLDRAGRWAAGRGGVVGVRRLSGRSSQVYGWYSSAEVSRWPELSAPPAL